MSMERNKYTMMLNSNTTSHIYGEILGINTTWVTRSGITISQQYIKHQNDRESKIVYDWLPPSYAKSGGGGA